jgi:hypothetical protein
MWLKTPFFRDIDAAKLGNRFLTMQKNVLLLRVYCRDLWRWRHFVPSQSRGPITKRHGVILWKDGIVYLRVGESYSSIRDTHSFLSGWFVLTISGFVVTLYNTKFSIFTFCQQNVFMYSVGLRTNIICLGCINWLIFRIARYELNL